MSRDIWEGLVGVLVQAIPSLERRSLTAEDPNLPGYAGSNSSHIAVNFLPLLRDIDRIYDLCIIARNMLATKQDAQDLAAEAKFDQQILKLIGLCIRIAARGYDGEAGTRVEEKWQRVVNGCMSLTYLAASSVDLHDIFTTGPTAVQGMADT